MRTTVDFGKVNLPDFIIVGAAKSGTSSLHHYLNEHPEVFMPWHKETWFFHLIDNPNKVILERFPYLPTNFLSYAGLFHGAGPSQVCGEATPSYLYYHDLTIRNIKKLHPCWEELKIIIILREPIDKVISHYKFVHTLGLDPENLRLKDALVQEARRIKDNKCLLDLFYVDNTLYYKQVKSYLDNFRNVKIFLYDELRDNPSKVVEELYNYVGVDSSFRPVSLANVYNKSNDKLIPRNELAGKVMQQMKKFNKLAPPLIKTAVKKLFLKREQIDPQTLDHLKNAFREDVEKLSKIITKDLSHWISRYK